MGPRLSLHPSPPFFVVTTGKEGCSEAGHRGPIPWCSRCWWPPASGNTTRPDPTFPGTSRNCWIKVLCQCTALSYSNFSRKHQSRDVIFSGQKLPQKCQILSLYMRRPRTLKKKALLASHDVIISNQFCVSKLQRVFTLGDGCWLPIFCFGEWISWKLQLHLLIPSWIDSREM